MSHMRTRIYLELSPQCQRLLSDNGLSVEEILRQENVAADVTYGLLPDEHYSEGFRSKEAALIILASDGLVLAIGTAISKVLHVLLRRPHLVEYYELEELRDAKGNVLLDQQGEPQLKRVKKFELLEPRKEDSNQSLEFNLTPSSGLVIKFDSTELQSGTNEDQKSEGT